MIRILHRHFLREVAGPTALAFLLYTLVMLINQFFLLAEYAYRFEVPVGNLTRLFALQLPHIVVLTLPMALLVGVLVATARLSADSELVALSASGVSLGTLLVPVLVLALVFGAATSWFAFELMPRGNRAITRALFEIFRENLLRNVREREFTSRLLSGANLYVHRIERDDRGDRWLGVLLDPAPRTNRRREVYFAREARTAVDPEADRLILTLSDVTVHGAALGDASAYDVRTIAEYTQILPPPPLLVRPEGPDAPRSVREMTLGELWARDRRGEPDDRALRRLTRVEIHKRIAIPCACLVFAFLGLGLGASARRAGRAYGFLASLGVFLVYYQTFYAGERLATTGDLPPWLAMWGGNLLFGAAGGFLFLQRATEGRALNRLRRVWAALAPAERLEAWRRRRAGRPRRAVLGRSRRTFGFPTILDRYILQEFSRVLLLVLGSGVALYVQVTLFQYLDDILRNNVPLRTVAEFYLAWLPEILSYVLPMAVLVATVIALSLLTRTNEVTAMLVNGVSLRRIAAPVLLAGLGLTAFTFVLYDRWLPRSAERWERLNDVLRGVPKRPPYSPGRWVALVGGERFLRYDAYDRERALFYRPALYELDPEAFLPLRVVHGQRARWEDYRLVFENGTERAFEAAGAVRYGEFAELPLPFLEPRPDFAREWRNPRHMTSSELVAYINWRQEHLSQTRELQIELRNKRAYPFITLVMVVLGLPFAFAIGRRGNLYGIGIAIVLAAVYWSAVVAATYLGKLGALPPEVAAWSPNLFFGLVGAAAFLNLRS